MGEKPTVAIRANSTEQKQKWKDAVEESEEYDSLTHLIRKSVERELAAEGRSRGGNPQGSANDERIVELIQNVERVHHSLRKMGAKLEEATDAMYESTNNADYTPEIFEALPQGEENAIPSVDIAEELDIPRREVSVTLQRLRHNTGAVKTTERDQHPDAAPSATNTLWYKEV